MTLIKSISGIRGTIGGESGKNLTPNDVVKYASAYGTWLINQGNTKKVIIGRDGRISGSIVSQLVAATLQSIGIDVIDIDLTTTPTLEMMVVKENAGGGIMITASHNPKQWNALKLLNEKGEFIDALEGAKILELAESNLMFAEVHELGSYSKNEEALDYHIEEILKLPLVKQDLIKAMNYSVVLDPVNSTGAIAIPALLDKLGVKYSIINGEINGIFNHNPEPLPENLVELCQTVKQENADLGISVDPDVDRLSIVTETGDVFGEEYTLVAVCDYVLKHNLGNTVSNLSSTKTLKEVTLARGGKYEAAAVGEVNVVTKMKENNAVIGGEGNGGIIYPELHYGRDALVGVALFLSYMAEEKLSASALRQNYPFYTILKNKLSLQEGTNLEVLFEEIKKKYSKYKLNTIDGIKIFFDEDWVHLRRSNTEPIIRIYCESESKTTANNLANKVMKDIGELLQKIEK